MSTPAAIPGDIGFVKKAIGSCEMFGRNDWDTLNSNITVMYEDYPELAALPQHIQDCNCIKYAAYRTASKLRWIQKCTYWDRVDLPAITNIFEAHFNTVINFKKLEETVNLIYSTKIEFPEQDQSQIFSQAVSSIIFNIYDLKKTGVVRTLCAKSLLTILADAKPSEKFKYIIQQYINEDGSIEAQKVIELLSDISRIAEYLDESNSFGSHMVPAAFQSCLAHYSGCNQHSVITPASLLSWLLQDPQNLVWISAISRLQMAESVQHKVKCNVCDIFPITGLRYRCLRCFNFNMCQDCFLTGRTTKGHKINHPLHEYSQESSSRVSRNSFWEILKNKLTMKTIANTKMSYLPLTVSQAQQHQCVSDATCSCPNTRKTIAAPDEGNVTNNDSKELESIIVHLEEENRHLQMEIDTLHEANVSQWESTTLSRKKANLILKQEILADHSHQLEIQLKRLRALVKETKKTMKRTPSADFSADHDRLQSTPANIEPVDQSFDMFSPIRKTENVEKFEDVGNDLNLSSLIAALQDFGSRDDEAESEEQLSLSVLISALQSMATDPVDHLPPTPPLSISSGSPQECFNTLESTIRFSFKDISESLIYLRDQVKNLPPSPQIAHIRTEVEEILDQMETCFTDQHSSQGENWHHSHDRNELLIIAQDIGNILANIVDGFPLFKHLSTTPSTEL